MSPMEMLEESVAALARGQGVIMTIPKGSTPRGFPRGEVLNEVERNGRIERTSRYEPEKVLGWMVKHGLVEMTRDDGMLRFKLLVGQVEARP